MLTPCRTCGQEVAPDAKSCPHCGTPHPANPAAAKADKIQNMGCALTLGCTLPILLGLLLLGMCA